MPSLRQRLAFLRSVGPRYTLRLIQAKCGIRRATWRIGGKRWLVPLYKRGAVQMFRDTERWMLPLLRTLLPLTQGRFIDVGANVGQTLLRLRTLDSQRPWVGIEPGPVILQALKEVIAINALEQCTVVESALGDACGRVKVYGVTDSDAATSMVEDLRAPGDVARETSYEVPVVNGADLADTSLATPVGMIKIDVEGGELEVLRGLKSVIQRDRPLMICEFLPVHDDGTERARRMLTRQASLADLLRESAYRMTRICLDGGWEDRDAPRNDVTGWESNYVVLPAERYGQIRPLLER